MARKLVYVAKSWRQCGRCHGRMTWNIGAVGRTAHPIICASCIWPYTVPVGFMRLYLDEAERALACREAESTCRE